MRSSGFWSVLITIAVIFSAGMVVGMWVIGNTQLLSDTRTDTPPPKIPVQPTTYQPTESAESIIMKVHNELSPTVVNIVATTLNWDFWMKLVPTTGQGTGFVIDSEGHILTNNHVIGTGPTPKLEVTFVGDKKVTAELVGQDPLRDLAVIKVKPFPGMKVAPLGDSSRLAVGQRVIAIGNPFGFHHTVTSGFISALNRDVQINQRPIMGLIQTDAAINPGNSGGPLIDARGKVIGVNTAIYSRSGGFDGIGLALPINVAKQVAADIIRLGRAVYPWLGVESSIKLWPQFAMFLGLPADTEGIMIVTVSSDSPAAEHGLSGARAYGFLGGRPLPVGGDVITSVDGTATPNYEDYRQALLKKKVGDTVTVTGYRGKRRFSVELTLAPHPGARSQNGARLSQP